MKFFCSSWTFSCIRPFNTIDVVVIVAVGVVVDVVVDVDVGVAVGVVVDVDVPCNWGQHLILSHLSDIGFPQKQSSSLNIKLVCSLSQKFPASISRFVWTGSL